MAKCPKCGYSFKFYELKPNCPKCKINLMNYQLDKRLDADAVKVEEEIILFKKIKKSLFGMWQSAVRLLLYIIATVVLLAPMFKMTSDNGIFASGDSVSLLSIIMKIFRAEDKMGALTSLFSNQTMILITVFFVGSILLNLVSLVLSSFSYTKIGTPRNLFMSAITLVLQMVVTAILVLTKSASIQPFLIITVVVYVLLIVFSLLIKKEFDRHTVECYEI